MGEKTQERRTVTFAGMARIQDDLQLYGPVEERYGPRPGSNTQIISRIHPVNLEDSVGESRGDYTAVSIIDPTMRIERSPRLDPTDESESLFRIIVTFVLQASILSFDNPNQRHNRFLDSVSLRYVYRKGERNEVLPEGDVTSADIKVTQETLDRNTIGMGVQSQPFSPPTINVQAQRDSKLAYERPMRSWRKGLSYEQYPPIVKKEEQEPSLLAAVGLDGPVEEPCPPAFFHVESKHARKCWCKPPHRFYCHYRESERHPCNRAARWMWQTEAMLHLWTPEVYQALNCPITIIRKVDAEEVDRILNRGHQWDMAILRRHLHFDFDVEVRVREIGHGFLDQMMPITKPAEIRAKDDFGKLMPADKSVFCLSPCLNRMHWPKFETRNLQREAEEQARKNGYVSRLPSDEEYIRAENSRLHAESKNNNDQNRQCMGSIKPALPSIEQGPAGTGQLPGDVRSGHVSASPAQYSQLPAPIEYSPAWDRREYTSDFRPRDARYVVADSQYRRCSQHNARSTFDYPYRQLRACELGSDPGRRPGPKRKRSGTAGKSSLAGILVNLLS